MADLASITAVRPTVTTQLRIVQYGATIAVGQPIYKGSDNKYLLADADLSTAAAAAEGIAMTPGVDGGYGVMAFGGPVILVGTTMVVGETYLVSHNAGGIMPNSDKVSPDKITRLGTASSATQLNLSVEATGIQAA